MPRRKRARNGKPKGKLTMKERDDMSDVSMCSVLSEAPMTKDEIVSRLLEDFQFAVQSRISQIKAAMNKAITDQKNVLRMELLKIPKDIRKMKVSEFLNAGGDMDEVMMNVAEPVDENVPSLETHENIIAAATTAKRTSRKPRVAKTPMHAPAAPTPAGRSTRGAKLKALAVLRQNEFVTPARGMPDIPIITPKVPPSACLTAGRKPKQGGELLYSLAGSPVQGLPIKNELMNFALKEGVNFDVTGAILDMSPKSLAAHADQLSKIKTIVESKLQQIEKSAVPSSVRKTVGKRKQK